MKRILTLSLLATSLMVFGATNVCAVGAAPVSGITLAVEAEQNFMINANGTSTSGEITRGGILDGTTSDVFMSAFVPTPDPNTVSLIDALTITTAHGILNCSDVTLFKPAQKVFTTIATISSGTGIFQGATGTLFFSGSSTDGVHFQDRIFATITIFPNI